MKRRALGKGLGSLLPGRPPVAQEPSEGYIEVSVDEVVPNPSQPRSHFDDEDMADLADSIRGAGVLNPILVRDTGSGYELIAGERRLRAARLAGLTHVPARVQRVGRGRSLELAIIENIQRQQLNPIEEARAFSSLMVEFGLTQEEVASQVGRKRTSVTNTLRLLKLPEKVQLYLEDGKLTAGHAKALLALESDEEILNMAEAFVTGAVTVRSAEEMTHSRAGRTARKTPVGTDPNVADAEQRLQRALGTKVRIRRSSEGKGRIEIEFYSDEELQRLFEMFEGHTH
jgi:ParB family transcriptional regulator, chromosome partitioning protein